MGIRAGYLLLPLLIGGCVVVRDRDDDFVGYVPSTDGRGPTRVLELTIDPDQFIDVEPATGAGVYVEYESGGLWWVSTTCDSELTGFECVWDIVVSVDPGRTMTLVNEEELERDDRVVRIDDGSLRMIAYTDVDFDSMAFETGAGMTVRFDVLLDGISQPRFFNWIGDGGLQQGAPSNPLDLTPAE